MLMSPVNPGNLPGEARVFWKRNFPYRVGVRLAGIAIMAFVVGYVGPHLSAAAHDIGWRWDYFGGYAIVENRTVYYGSYVSSAGINYNNNTDLHVDSCPDNGNCGRIVYLQGNYGATGWPAGTVAYDGLNPCVSWPSLSPNGNCDAGSRKADFAYVYANDYYGSWPYPDWIARHEMGHAFGLAHPSCSTWSVMMTGLCGSGPNSLTTHDISDINGWY